MSVGRWSAPAERRGGRSAAGAAVAALARGQHGVVSVGQLRGAGLNAGAVRRRLADGRLHRVHADVYAVGHAALTRRGHLMAAVLACGPDAAISHRSAARMWDLGRGGERPEVTVPHRRAGAAGVVIHRSRLVARGDFTVLDGIRVTTVARTLLDLAGSAPADELARAVDRAERLGLFDLAAIEEALARARGRRGAAALRAAIAGWQPGMTRSELEDRFRALVAESGLPAPRGNALVDGDRATHEVDALWQAQRLAVQLDGFAYHRTRRDRERDAAADADLELAGYRVTRLTWDDVTRRRGITCRRLRRLLEPSEGAGRPGVEGAEGLSGRRGERAEC